MRPRIKPHRIRPGDVGWRLGRAGRFGPELWVPFDRTTCVIGPQGSGKTLDLLVPALLEAPGAALGDADQARGPVPHPGGPTAWWPAGRGARPVRPRARHPGAGLGPDRRV